METTNAANLVDKPRSRWRRPLLIGALVASIGGAFAAAGCGHHGPGWGGHGHAQSPQATAERAERATDWVLGKVNATDAQRQQIKGIVKNALNDLMPTREQHLAARQAMIDALAQPTLDKQKLEELRRAELQRAESASQRLLQAVTEAAEVLTPEQRAELAKLAARHRGHPAS